MRLLRTLMVVMLWLAAVPAFAAEPVPAPTPDKLQALSDLLADPAVRDWLAQQARNRPAGATAPPAENADTGLSSMFLDDLIDDLRGHVDEVDKALPSVPTELSSALTRLRSEEESFGLGRAFLLLLSFVALGLVAEAIFWQLTKNVTRRISAAPVRSLADRLRAMGTRLAFATVWIGVFALGSIGPFVLFNWPPLIRKVMLGYLLVVLVIRLTIMLGRFFLSPGAEKFRIIPTSTEAAWFWHRRMVIGVGWIAFLVVTRHILETLGMSDLSIQIAFYPFSLITLALLVEAIWNQPPRVTGTPRVGRGVRIALIGYVAVAWLVGRVLDVRLVGVLMVVGLLLPLAIRITHRAVMHMLRPTDLDGDNHFDGVAVDATPSHWAVAIERLLRLVFFMISAWYVLDALSIDMMSIATSDSLAARVIRRGITAITILLAADLIWQLAKTTIEKKLALAANVSESTPAEQQRHYARVRTLLPILRNILFIVLLTMAVLTALSTIGIEVAPLIAGAGVIGVAVGFGAQTLVKDIISGMFYLLDDAFRVGEYIVSGSYKGTVESFSLRSVKLRHHRGPLYTVPFGSLGAIQNLSRDWVIDKMSIKVPFDTDLDLVKRIIKQIGKDLLADPELGPGFIEPLKMQGVEAFDDYAIQIRLKMMTYPNKQFSIRRRAYLMLKREFDRNGLKFAFPTVQVASDRDVDVAVAKTVIDAQMKPAEAT